VAGSIWSFHDYEASTITPLGKPFLATAPAAIAQLPKGAEILDAPISADVGGGLLVGTADLPSYLLAPWTSGPAASRPRFVTRPDGSYDDLFEFDSSGSLAAAVVEGVPSQPLPPGRCWRVRHGQALIGLYSIAKRPSMMRFDYQAKSAGQVVVEFGGHTQVLSVEKGAHKAYLPVRGSGKSILVTSLTGSVPCITDAQVGVVAPSAWGPWIPGVAG
ncbi:MAG TPA: hypothetical protein VNF47_06635, partial [Streptosporangiaceae bacterium]|nr:hypothetical protein [Streptosporangiaceae bacterium]